MITESLIITLLGMGSVFFFLFLLVCFMHLLSIVLKEDTAQNMDKKALAIVLALRAQKGK